MILEKIKTFLIQSDIFIKHSIGHFFAKIWIILNAVLIVSTIIKNSEYVSSFGLTYKRLGVYAFLILAIIGLVYTFLKIAKQKTKIPVYVEQAAELVPARAPRKFTRRLLAFGIFAVAVTLPTPALAEGLCLEE